MRSEITSVARVANVLLLRFVAGNMDVNTPASKRSQLIGNTAIVRVREIICAPITSCCVGAICLIDGSLGGLHLYYSFIYISSGASFMFLGGQV